MASITTIINWFKTGLKPTEAQFKATWESFWHKDEDIPVGRVDGIDVLLDSKAERELLDTKANLVEGKVPVDEQELQTASQTPLLVPGLDATDVAAGVSELLSKIPVDIDAEDSSLRIVSKISDITENGAYIVTNDDTSTNVLDLDTDTPYKINELEDFVIVDYKKESGLLNSESLAKIRHLQADFNVSYKGDSVDNPLFLVRFTNPEKLIDNQLIEVGKTVSLKYQAVDSNNNIVQEVYMYFVSIQAFSTLKVLKLTDCFIIKNDGNFTPTSTFSENRDDIIRVYYSETNFLEVYNTNNNEFNLVSSNPINAQSAGFKATIYNNNGLLLGNLNVSEVNSFFGSTQDFLNIEFAYIEAKTDLKEIKLENRKRSVLKKTILKDEISYYNGYLVIPDIFSSKNLYKGEVIVSDYKKQTIITNIEVGIYDQDANPKPYVLKDNTGTIKESDVIEYVDLFLSFKEKEKDEKDHVLRTTPVYYGNVLNFDDVGSNHAQAMEFWFKSYYEHFSGKTFENEFITTAVGDIGDESERAIQHQSRLIVRPARTIIINDLKEQGNDLFLVYAHATNQNSDEENTSGMVSGQILNNTVIIRGGVLGEDNASATSSYGIGVTFVVPASAKWVNDNATFIDRTEAIANNAQINNDVNSNEHAQSPGSAFMCGIVRAIIDTTGIHNPKLIIQALIITADRSGGNTAELTGAYGQPWNKFDGYGMPRYAEAVAYINSTIRPEIVKNTVESLHNRLHVPDHFTYKDLPQHVAPSKVMIENKFNVNLPLVIIDLGTGTESGSRVFVKVVNGLVIVDFVVKLSNTITSTGNGSLFGISFSESIPQKYGNLTIGFFNLSSPSGRSYIASSTNSTLDITTSENSGVVIDMTDEFYRTSKTFPYQPI